MPLNASVIVEFAVCKKKECPVCLFVCFVGWDLPLTITVWGMIGCQHNPSSVRTGNAEVYS